MSDTMSHVLYSTEAESIIEGLQTFCVIAVGSPRWQQQHEYLEKLNMQAVLSASTKGEEFVKEQLVSLEKIPLVIHELIAVETWKTHVFPHFLRLKLEPAVMFPLYMVLYHEATVSNLLELVLFHRDACESAEDNLLDLVDYCHRKLVHLIGLYEDGAESKVKLLGNKSSQDKPSIQTLQDLNEINESLNYDLDMKVLSITRYLTDNVPQVSLSAMNRMLNIHDFPLVLVKVIEIAPWARTRKVKGKDVHERYVDTKWVTIDAADRNQLTKMEAQVWLSLYSLLLSEDGRRKYEYNTHRKNTLLRLRSHLTEMLKDQLPVLGDLQRYLEELAMMEPPSAKSALVIEQLPELQEKMLRENKGRWEEIACKQSDMYYNPEKVDMRKQAQRLAQTYSLDMLDSLITEPPKCGSCGAEAAKRCSRCKNEWYCRRECQVQHWPRHKLACNLMTTAEQKAQQTNNR